MSFATELRALQDAWVAPPPEERLVLTEEAQWVRLLEQCYARAQAGCATCGYTLAANIETKEQYDVFIARRERFRVRLEAEGLRMQEQRDVPQKATYKNAYGDECPTSYDIHFVVTWR